MSRQRGADSCILPRESVAPGYHSPSPVSLDVLPRIDGRLGAHLTTGVLHMNTGQAQPALHQIALQVDVVDARVREVDNHLDAIVAALRDAVAQLRALNDSIRHNES